MRKYLFLGALLSSLISTAADLYTNPVIKMNFPDPTVIQGDEGYFYAYATQGRLGDIPIFRSADLVDWEYTGNAFPDPGKRPDLLPGGNLWAPDIIKLGDKYVLIYSQSKWGEEHKNGLGFAISDNPAGPFENQGKLFTSDEIGVQNSIDPSLFLDDDGRLYLLWGSFSGLYLTEMDTETLALKDRNNLKQVAGAAFEGSHIFKRNGLYYLFASLGTCCEGERSTYRVGVGRSSNLTGPYMNQDGERMLDNAYELVVEGDEFCKGPGHGSKIITDKNGDTWYLFHGYQAGSADKGRMLWMDKIEWDEEGWPYIQNLSPSHTPQAAPVF